MKTFDQFLARIAAAILIVSLLFAEFSCGVSKNISHSSLNKDSIEKEAYRKRVTELELEVQNYRKRVQEMEYLGITFQKCPEIDTAEIRRLSLQAGCPPTIVDALLDSLNKAIDDSRQKDATIQLLADGTLNVKGQVASLTKSKSKLQEENMELMTKNVRLQDSLAAKETQLSVAENKSSKVVDRWFIPWWIWLIIGALVILNFKTKIKNLFKNTDMKKAIVSLLLAAFLTSCGHHSDGSSVWQEGLWVIPTITSIAAVIFFIQTYRSANSNSTQQDGRRIKDNTGNVPFWKMGRFWFGVGFVLATVGIVIWVNLEK